MKLLNSKMLRYGNVLGFNFVFSCRSLPILLDYKDKGYLLIGGIGSKVDD